MISDRIHLYNNVYQSLLNDSESLLESDFADVMSGKREESQRLKIELILAVLFVLLLSIGWKWYFIALLVPLVWFMKTEEEEEESLSNVKQCMSSVCSLSTSLKNTLRLIRETEL